MNEILVGGIDVSKHFSDLCVLSPQNAVLVREKIYHDLTSMQRALKILQGMEQEYGHKPVLVMESTSHYHLLLHQFFKESGFEVIVVNPLQSSSMKNFEIRKRKTDKVDAYKLASLEDEDGEIRVVMEHTGMYWRPVALALQQAGFFVSVVNAILIHNFSDNSLRKIKTDKADALKIANYGLTFWMDLREYSTEDETRQMLKIQSRLYERTTTTGTMLRNGLISLLDQTFPSANKLFLNEGRNTKGHVKWVDFVIRFWHKECVAALSLHTFADTFQKWCKRTGYRFSTSDAERIHTAARNSVATLPKNDSTKLLITQAAISLNTVYDSLHALRTEMNRLTSLLPEYELVMAMEGVGKITGPQLMAEIGDVRRFSHKSALVAYAGADAPPYQSGTFDAKNRHVSKRGSPHLRKVLFEIASMILVHGNPDNSVFCFMDKKRAEGKHFYVYTVAGAAKFLRIYYARVKEYLNTQEIA